MHNNNLIKHIGKQIVRSLLVIPIVLLSLSTVIAATVGMQEASLSTIGDLRTLNIASDGTVLLVGDSNELWSINPDNWQYSKFEGVGGDNLADIALESPTEIWWTDNWENFGSFDLSTRTLTKWQMIAEGDESLPQLGSIVYQDGYVWLLTWYGSGNQFGLFKFDPVTEDLVLNNYFGGSNTVDLVYSHGAFWSLDWFSKSLIRFDPATGLQTKFTPNPARLIDDTANIQTDGSLLWWTEDREDGAVVSYDPVSGMMKAYDLPAGTDPRNVSIHGGYIWYSDVNGSLGRIDPASAASTTLIVDDFEYPVEIVPEPYAVSESIISTVATPTNGTFSFSDFDSTQSAATGLQVYSLPEGASPWGIAAMDGSVLVADNGREKLIRLPLGEPSEEGLDSFIPLFMVP